MGPSHRIRLLSRRGVHVLTILLIADQDRLEKLFDFVRDYPQIRFRVSRSLRQGTQDIAEDPPSLLFVQNHLSGLSGEIIARHLVGQVEGVRPRVVLFGKPGRQLPDQDTLDACLDIARTDEELTAAIIGIIAEPPSPSTAGKPPLSVQTEEAAPIPSVDEEPFAPAPHPEAEPSEPELPVPATDTVHDVYDREASQAPAPPETPFDQTLKTVIGQSPEPVPLTEMEDTVSFSDAAAPPPRAPRRRRIGTAGAKTRSPLLWAGLAAVAAVAVGGAILLYSSTSPPPDQPLKPAAPAMVRQAEQSVAPSPAPAPQEPPAAAAPAVAPSVIQAPQPQPQQPVPSATPPATGAGKGLAQLPSFIPREGHDRDYGKSHPGWERYRGARTEFKVYRDDTAIRAIQAIDRSGVGIPESFFRGALGQMTNSREFILESKETQGRFRVEKGAVTGGAQLVVYRTIPKGAIRAFVVHFN